MKKAVLYLTLCSMPSLLTARITKQASPEEKKPETTVVTHQKLAIKKLEECKSFITTLLKKLVSPGMVMQSEIVETLQGFNKRLIELADSNGIHEQKAAILSLLDKGLAIEDDLNSLASKNLKARLEELVSATDEQIKKLRALLTPRVAAMFSSKQK